MPNIFFLLWERVSFFYKVFKGAFAPLNIVWSFDAVGIWARGDAHMFYNGFVSFWKTFLIKSRQNLVHRSRLRAAGGPTTDAIIQGFVAACIGRILNHTSGVHTMRENMQRSHSPWEPSNNFVFSFPERVMKTSAGFIGRDKNNLRFPKKKLFV